jgi:hypothetical protein
MPQLEKLEQVCESLREGILPPSFRIDKFILDELFDNWKLLQKKYGFEIAKDYKVPLTVGHFYLVAKNTIQNQVTNISILISPNLLDYFKTYSTARYSILWRS